MSALLMLAGCLCVLVLRFFLLTCGLIVNENL